MGAVRWVWGGYGDITYEQQEEDGREGWVLAASVVSRRGLSDVLIRFEGSSRVARGEKPKKRRAHTHIWQEIKSADTRISSSYILLRIKHDTDLPSTLIYLLYCVAGFERRPDMNTRTPRAKLGRKKKKKSTLENKTSSSQEPQLPTEVPNPPLKKNKNTNVKCT